MLAALGFGLTTPLIQRLGQGVGPIPSATLLYAGAAVASIDVGGKRESLEASVRQRHLPRLALVALAGAVVAPVCLTWGLQRTPATGASLLLNFEAFFTVLLAWAFYREPLGRRVVLALAVMSLGAFCMVSGAGGGGRGSGLGWGALAVVLATLAWAIDNTLTRPLADLNPTQVVRWKAGLGAGVGVGLALLAHQPFPRLAPTLGLLACGATGYGLSLRLYLLAQRRIGAARTGSIFALAPFVGVAAAWALGDRSGDLGTVAAGALFGFGIYLHLTEKHLHGHVHEALYHEHAHRHDDGHHDHHHDEIVVGPHSHLHQHEVRTHEHPHAADLHHHHRHA